ncbi:MAG: response regulator transcription factor [Gemmataceae bacterium]
MAKTKLLLVDDHTIVRAGLRALFDRQPDMTVSAEAENTKDATAALERERPDVLVLDLTLPGGGSLDLIRTLRMRNDPPHVLVLTMHDDPAYARAALSAGAIGYVVKTISEQSLLGAVRAVRHGQIFIDLDDEARTASVLSLGRDHGTVTKLSERELEVLTLLGRGHTNQEVAEQLDLSPKTVATYKARIAEKFGLKTTADFVKYATDTGLLGPTSK